MMRLSKQDKKIFYALLFPVLIETVISRIFHIADSMMIGQMENSTVAVAAVGLCVSPTNIIISVTTAFFIGTTATVAWYYGADEKKRMRTVAWQSMGIAFVIAVLFFALSFFGAGTIIGFVCGKSEAYPLAMTYYRINAIGFFFQILTANITAALRGIGVSKTAMMYNLTGGVVNVALNYALIYGKLGLPAMGVAGAAWATVISKIVSFVIAVFVIVFTKSELNFRLGINKKFDKAFKTRFFPIACTSASEQLILQSGAMLTAKIVATLSTASIAANQVISSIEGFAWATGSACQVASTSLFGRSLGEHNEKKARAYLSFSLKWAVGFALAEVAMFVFLGKYMAVGFSNDKSLYPLICTLLLFSAAELPFINAHQTVSGALRSVGDTIAPLVASFISLWVFRVALGYVIIVLWDKGIYAYRIVLVLDQFVRCTVMSIFYLKNHWKKYTYKKR